MRALNVFLAILVSLALGFAVFELGLRLIPAFSPPQTSIFAPSHTSVCPSRGRGPFRVDIGRQRSAIGS